NRPSLLFSIRAHALKIRGPGGTGCPSIPKVNVTRAEIAFAVSRPENTFLDLPIMTRIKAYQEDLAYIHDVGFDFYARGVAPELLKIFRRHGITKGLVVDLGCGSGIWAAELIRAGYDVLGVDISESMIRLARKKAPQAKFVRSSFLDVPLPPCDAVTSLG